MTMSDDAIRIQQVTKVYRLYKDAGAHILDKLKIKNAAETTYRDFAALNGIDAVIKKGERVGLVGRNGAGKTTLLKLLIGHIKPTNGNISVTGSVHAMMKSDLGFHVHFTGRENVLASLAYSGIFGDQALALLADIEQFTELGDYLDQPFMNYSLGMQSRLMFGVASAIRPDILIVDEMLGAGDSYFMSKSAKRMQGLIDDGCTLFLVSHNTQQIMQFCDRAIWLRDGQVYADASARDIVNSYDVYIERETENRHKGIGVKDKTDDRKTIVKSDGREFMTVLEDGKHVYRWPSSTGVKLCGLGLRANGDETDIISADDEVRLKLDLAVEETRHFRCRYLVTVWDMKGKRIARIENEGDGFDGTAGSKRPIEILLSPLQIGAGRYTISVSIYDLSDSGSTAEGRMSRMDVVAHGLDFRVKESAVSKLTPKIHLAGRWHIESQL